MYLEYNSALIQAHGSTYVDEKQEIMTCLSPHLLKHLTTGTRPGVEATALPSSAPIFLLPPETLQYIFTLCLPRPSKSLTPDSRRHSCTAPLVLTQICSSFRSLVLSTPELWLDWVLRTSKDVTRAERWLERAGGFRPLNVAYDICIGNQFDIAKISNRIGAFNVFLTEDQLHHLFMLAELSLDSLTDLSITIPKPASYSKFQQSLPHTATLGTLESFPAWAHLRRLSLNLPLVLSPSLSYLTDLFPWSQLTYLSVSSLHYSVVTSLLSLCTNLQEAHIELYTPNAMVREIESPAIDACDHVVLEHLHSLSFISDHFLRLNTLDGLFVPNLRSLSIVHKGNERTNAEVVPREWKPWAHTRAGYEHFFSQLRGLERLKLSQNIPARRALEILEYTSELRKLELTMYREVEIDDVLEGLLIGERDVVPKLKDLEVTVPFSTLEDTTTTKLKALVGSRLGVLENVEIGKSGQGGKERAEVLRAIGQI